MRETLNGLFERVTFHNPENGFAVLRVKVRGWTDPVTVVGNATSVSAGEHLQASGRWVIDPQHGQQFKADELTTTHPASAEGIEKYLACGAARSIGPKLAAKIVFFYRERTLEIFENYPEMLLHVKGIGRQRLRRIWESWREQKEVRKIMLFLSEQRISAGRTVRIYRTYGQEAIAKIKENPYRLADDIRGIGFQTADEVAAQLGLDLSSPYRARAAVGYTLQELASEGHCGYPETGVVEEAIKLGAIDRAIIEEAVQTVVREGRGTVAGEPWLYLASLYRAEVGLAAWLPPADVEAMPLGASELTDHLAFALAAQGTPRLEVDVLADEMDGSISHQDLDASFVLAAGGEDASGGPLLTFVILGGRVVRPQPGAVTPCLVFLSEEPGKAPLVRLIAVDASGRSILAIVVTPRIVAVSLGKRLSD